MKKFLFFASLFVSSIFFAQDLEDRLEMNTENSRNINQLEIKKPFFQLAIKDCDILSPAQFEGGTYAFSSLLSKYMMTYLNSDMYRLNGDFSFVITINKEGDVTDVEGHPEVPNSKYFFEEMKYIFRRINKKWKPATCVGVPTTSKVKINMTFSSMGIEV